VGDLQDGIVYGMITTMKNKTSNTNLKAIFTNAHNKASTIA